MENIFKFALKNKVRFNYRGLISTEDLYDLNLRELDCIYKNLMEEKKTSEIESLIENHTENLELNCKIEIVKYIFNEKVEEQKAAEKRAENEEKKQKILAILARKQDAELEGKSIDELKTLLADI